MKKEDFLKLGFSEEDAQKAADASAEELKSYIPKSRFDEVNTEKKRLETDIQERDTQIETLKNSTEDVEGLKKQITTLQEENKTKDEQRAAEIKQVKTDAAISAALAASKAKNEKAVRALLDLDLEKVEFNDDGSIKGLADQLKTLTEAEDSKFLFETGTQQQMKGAVPGETGKENPDGKVDISKMNYDELAKYLDENPDADI
ncbi:phage scaffolding protein [Chryseomicrobium palamuruense]|uniref:Phage scaffolding protein n=1 Tax=Chryseomicrobium palamuruense TaxID=682973 RepID=A0ABV8UW96_9BACL